MEMEHRALADVLRWAGRSGDGPSPELVVVDARSPDAFADGHIAGAWSVPLDDVARLAGGLPRDKELVTYCWSRT